MCDEFRDTSMFDEEKYSEAVKSDPYYVPDQADSELLWNHLIHRAGSW